jgi:hypothetical protein
LAETVCDSSKSASSGPFVGRSETIRLKQGTSLRDFKSRCDEHLKHRVVCADLGRRGEIPRDVWGKIERFDDWNAVCGRSLGRHGWLGLPS